MTPAGLVPGSFATQLDPAIWRAFAQRCRVATYPPRTTLFHQGDPSSHVMVLLAGWVKVTSVSRAGSEALLALRGPGDILGEMAAIDGLPRSATVTTLVTVRAQTIDGPGFVAALDHLRGLSLALLRHLTSNLRESDGKRLEYVSSNSSARLAALLLDLAGQHGRHTSEGLAIDIPLSQRELASAAATSREVVARVMRTLRARDVVRTSRRRVVVIQPDVLRSLGRLVSDDA